jgi:hypothetical protein
MSDSTQEPNNNEGMINADEKKTKEAEQAPAPTYSKAEFDRVLQEAKKFKDMAKDFEKKIKDRELSELEKNNEWQRIAEMKQKETEEAQAERDRLKEAFVSREKSSAIREAALAAGLRKESVQDLRLIDFPEIKLETNSDGEFSVSGADKAVTRLKTLRPHWFSSAAPKVNTDTPQVTNSGSNISWAEFKKIESEYRKSPTRENEQKLRLAYSKVAVEK